jgi:hypothetical protein
MKFYNAVEMRELSLCPTTYRAALAAIQRPVLLAMSTTTPTYTVTVVTSTYTAADVLQLKNDMIQLGYAVDDSTTPGSWIITW